MKARFQEARRARSGRKRLPFGNAATNIAHCGSAQVYVRLDNFVGETRSGEQPVVDCVGTRPPRFVRALSMCSKSKGAGGRPPRLHCRPAADLANHVMDMGSIV
jgi:hypothetical protein